jgi:hypothetical protein
LIGLTGNPFLSGALREGVRHVEVPAFTLTTLLGRPGVGHVDLLSLNTEGAELEIWRSLDLGRWRPEFVIVERNTWGLPTSGTNEGSGGPRTATSRCTRSAATWSSRTGRAAGKGDLKGVRKAGPTGTASTALRGASNVRVQKSKVARPTT